MSLFIKMYSIVGSQTGSVNESSGIGYFYCNIELEVVSRTGVVPENTILAPLEENISSAPLFL